MNSEVVALRLEFDQQELGQGMGSIQCPSRATP